MKHLKHQENGRAGNQQGVGMKKGWKSKTLEEVCQFSNGLWKGEKPPFVTVGVIRNTNFTKEGTLDDSEIAFLDVEAKKFEKRRLQFGDIILEKSGGGPKQPVGRVALFDKEDGDFSFSNFTAALRVLDSDNLDFRFVHKFLHWAYVSGVTEGMQSNSTGIRNLNGDAYKSIEMSFPPLAEQQRIVAILDEAFEGIATARKHAEQNLQNAKAMFESHLEAVFSQKGEGWVETTIGDVAETFDGPHATPKTVSEGPIFLGISSLQDGKINLRETRHVTQQDFKIWTRRVKPQENDIVFSYETRLGQAAIIPAGLECCLGRRMGLVRPNKQKLDSRFFVYQYVSPVFRSYLETKTIRGATVDRIALRDFPTFSLYLPNLETQTALASIFDTVQAESNRLCELYTQKIAALDALKKSLLHQAFSGEL